MATLNGTYQYIGRSNAVSCPSGWNYYILLYAKTSGDIATGKHAVSIKMRMACNVDSTFYGWNTTAFAKANGVTAFSWSKQQIPNSTWNRSALTEGGYSYQAWIDLKEGTAVVDAGFGVAKQINIEGSWVMNDTYSKGWFPYQGKYATASISVTLPMLASASTITSAANVKLGNNCSVTWTPQAASFRYKLKFSIGSWTGWSNIIHPNRNTSYTYTGYPIPLDAASYVPKKTGTMTVTLYTYSDSGATAQIGSADSETFTVTVPETSATKPTVSMGTAPKSDLLSPFDSLYIQGKSKVQATMSWSLKPGASLEDSNITVDNKVYRDPYVSDYLAKSGTFEVKGQVKDSRGHYGTTYQYITVIPYSKPKVQAVSGESNVVAARCDENGNLSDSGEHLKIKAKIWYEKVIANEVQNNFGKIQYRYKAAEAANYSSWQDILDTKTSGSEEVTTVPNVSLAIKKNYLVQVRAIDDITKDTEPVTLPIASDEVYMDRPAGGKSMGLGGYSTGDGRLDVYWNIKARGGLSLFNADGEEISADDILPLPRGVLEGVDRIGDGVYEVSNPLKHPTTGDVLMAKGVLIQMAATVDGSMKIQLAFPSSASYIPLYRIWIKNFWTEWFTFKN